MLRLLGLTKKTSLQFIVFLLLAGMSVFSIFLTDNSSSAVTVDGKSAVAYVQQSGGNAPIIATGGIYSNWYDPMTEGMFMESEPTCWFWNSPCNWKPCDGAESAYACIKTKYTQIYSLATPGAFSADRKGMVFTHVDNPVDYGLPESTQSLYVLKFPGLLYLYSHPNAASYQCQVGIRFITGSTGNSFKLVALPTASSIETTEGCANILNGQAEAWASYDLPSLDSSISVSSPSSTEDDSSVNVYREVHSYQGLYFPPCTANTSSASGIASMEDCLKQRQTSVSSLTLLCSTNQNIAECRPMLNCLQASNTATVAGCKDDVGITASQAERWKNGDTSDVAPSDTEASITNVCGELANPDDRAQCFNNAVTALNNLADTATDADTEEASSCAVDGIGWIVCPVMTFLGSISDLAYGFIANSFLKVDVGLVNTTLPSGAVNPTYSTWQTFRNIANVLFVIVFLIIVFSQLTSAGISNYGVKKMLPRLVIAAILVNASYFIAQIAVDISNILGYGLKSLFETLPIYTTAKPSGVEMIGQGLTWVALLGVILGAAVAIALAVSVPVLLAAVVSVLMIVLILIGRQALIVLLIILSPIAFVAWLLPNTEQYFKKWWKMFFTLLMVFPIVGVLFGASKLAATVLQAVGAGSSNELMQVIAMGVATIPLIMTPSLLKSSLNAAGSIGTTLGKLSGNANKGFLNKARTDSRLGEALKNRQLNNTRNRAAKRTRPGGWQGKLDDSPLGRKLGFRAGARATQITDAADQEEMKNAQALWERDGTGSNFEALEAIVNDKSISSVEGRAALAMLAAKGASSHVQRIRNGGFNKDSGKEIRSQKGADFDRTITPFFPALKAKDYRAVGLAGVHEGDKNLLPGVRAADMYTMSDDALEAGANADATFAATLRAATRDPEQVRYFSEKIKRLYGDGSDTATGPTPATPQAEPISTVEGAVETSQAPGETFVDLRSQPATPTMSDFERAEAEELARRQPPQNPS